VAEAHHVLLFPHRLAGGCLDGEVCPSERELGFRYVHTDRVHFLSEEDLEDRHPSPAAHLERPHTVQHDGILAFSRRGWRQLRRFPLPLLALLIPVPAIVTVPIFMFAASSEKLEQPSDVMHAPRLV